MNEPLLLKEESRGESRALNISLRGWIALIVIITLCYLCVLKDALDVLKDFALIIVGFYFGKQPQPPAPPASPS